MVDTLIRQKGLQVHHHHHFLNSIKLHGVKGDILSNIPEEQSREDLNSGVRVRLADTLPSMNTTEALRLGLLTDLRRSQNVTVWAFKH